MLDIRASDQAITEAQPLPSRERWFDKIRIMLHRLWCELCAYRGQTSLLLWCFAISMSMWLIDACILFSCIRGMAVEIPFEHVIGVNTTLNWAGVIPVSVGGAGVQEGTLVVLLREFSVTGSLAMAAGLSYRAVRLTVALLGGLMLLVAGFRSRTHPVHRNRLPRHGAIRFHRSRPTQIYVEPVYRNRRVMIASRRRSHDADAKKRLHADRTAGRDRDYVTAEKVSIAGGGCSNRGNLAAR
jgi:hypothetical protein